MKAKNGNAFPPTHAPDISTHNKKQPADFPPFLNNIISQKKIPHCKIIFDY